jgi:hypothetical protein
MAASCNVMDLKSSIKGMPVYTLPNSIVGPVAAVVVAAAAAAA